MEMIVDLAGILYLIWAYYAMNKYWYSKRTYIVFNSGKFFILKLCGAFVIGWIFVIIHICDLLYRLSSRLIQNHSNSVHSPQDKSKYSDVNKQDHQSNKHDIKNTHSNPKAIKRNVEHRNVIDFNKVSKKR